MATAQSASGRVEQHTIFPIPASQRHGRPRQLFTLWFGINQHLLTVVTGALATTALHLPLGPALAALALGNALGGVFMALHAAQGPHLGVPQMVQSRGQFGAVGAAFTLVAMLVVYVGFVASNFVVGGQALHGLAPALGANTAILALALLSALGAGVGYRLLHACGHGLTLVAGAALLASLAWMLVAAHGAQGLWARGQLSLDGVLSTLSICAVWQIAYAPYVSDYSRYLPADTGPRGAFWASYGGCVLGSFLPMALGAALGALTGSDNMAAGLIHTLGPAGGVVVAVLAAGLAVASATSIYCGGLTALTLVQTFAHRWRPGPGARVVLALALNALALGLALLASDRFLAHFESFLSLLLCLMAPWTAINLVDYYLLRRGDYDVAAFFAPDGGIYGRYNGPALTCLGLALVVQVPFIKTDLYTGPLVAALGGVDASWVVGLLVAGGLFYLWPRPAGVSLR